MPLDPYILDQLKSDNQDEVDPLDQLPVQAEASETPYWKIYCYIVTFWAPVPLLKLFGFRTKERQYAWREKIALISIILYIGMAMAFLTFGFTRTVCTGLRSRLQVSNITSDTLVVNGRAYDLGSSSHPGALGVEPGSNVLYPPINAGGKDASLLFQNVNGNCKDLITPKINCRIPFNENNELAWYMPCKVFPIDGSSKPDFSVNFYEGYSCHTSSKAREAFYRLEIKGDVYYTWEQVASSSRNLVVFNGHVLDMDLIDWILADDLDYPELFDDIKNDRSLRGYDISVLLSEPHERKIANCLIEIAKVGVIDVDTVGCIAASIVLYVSLVFVLSIVLSKFFIACYYKWGIAPRQGASKTPIKEMAARDRKLEEWADDPKSAVPLPTVDESKRAGYKGSINVKKAHSLSRSLGNNSYLEFADSTSSITDYVPKYVTMSTESFILSSQQKRQSRGNSKQSLILEASSNPMTGIAQDSEILTLDPSLVHPDIIPQPPINWEPFGYPLIHAMCLVTCYSEDEDGIRTTMDSIATTDYPNSHKLIVIVCDGLVTGAGNSKSTPDICLDIMTDFSEPVDQVQAYSYVSVAQGTKRHNMAKIYSGFYKYDNTTVPVEKQQKIPILLIIKSGTPDETDTSKPGNRGKRDSQIILMSFLQKVTFDERLTELEFEMLKSIWRVTGLMAMHYEALLMVDADTLVYPDSITHMIAEMVKSPEIMGLCGETRIANKAQSWVTAIQVFEYYISHHQSKAFESVFGSVTCLPGCFCMYRIKAPKSLNVWVPILACPDIVEKYSENVLNSLHKKNLLLLGEDRYLSSLMLRTFPRRKQVFVSKAACKTIVPHKFKVLLSQRRRWINSTVHNLMELVLVNNLCGTFCFSMQFIITVELIGTLVLPASISFTIYILVIAVVSTPTPVLSLILMGVIFGLPGLLIIVTVSNLSYILWMFVYFLSLPIWNFILPAYAFWKFDDFSWGDTRKTNTGDKTSHDNQEGEFDGSQIVHMTWRDFERRRNGLDGKHTMSTIYNSEYFNIDEEDQQTYVSDHKVEETTIVGSPFNLTSFPEPISSQTYTTYKTAPTSKQVQEGPIRW